jgi:response regulator of citrate/malate metabolism
MTKDKKQVVVIDDSLTTLLLFKSLLREIDKNLQVKLFDKAERGLKYLKTHKTDLLIIDLYMPRYCGLDIIKKIHPFEGMKILMVSANTKTTNIESALELGIDGYFTKPLKVKKIKEKIIETLNIKERLQIKEENQ